MTGHTTPSDTIGWPGDLGMVYETSDYIEVYGVEVYIDTLLPSTFLYATAWVYNSDSSEFWYIAQSADYWQQDTIINEWIRICFWGGAYFNAGDVFLISVGDYGTNAQIGMAQIAADSTVYRYVSGDTAFVPLNNSKTPMIRWNQHAECWHGLEEQKTKNLSFQISPNPTNENTTIQYQLETNALVELTLTDLSGRQLRRVDLGNQISGSHQFKLDLSDLQSGIYLVSLKAGAQHKTEKLIISK